jgi:hypothetical protein
MISWFTPYIIQEINPSDYPTDISDDDETLDAIEKCLASFYCINKPHSYNRKMIMTRK